MLLEALEERFGRLPVSVVLMIGTLQEQKVLKALHRIAIKVKTLDEFKKLLKPIED